MRSRAVGGVRSRSDHTASQRDSPEAWSGKQGGDQGLAERDNPKARNIKPKKAGEKRLKETELIQAAQQGDQEAFAQLVQANQSFVYHLAYRMTGSPEDAADLTQEAFLNAWRAIAKFQAQSAFSTWLYRLTSNACIDFLRREKRRRELSMTLDGEPGENLIQLQVAD